MVTSSERCKLKIPEDVYPSSRLNSSEEVLSQQWPFHLEALQCTVIPINNNNIMSIVKKIVGIALALSA